MATAHNRVNDSDYREVTRGTEEKINGRLRSGGRGMALPCVTKGRKGGLNVVEITEQMGTQMTTMTAKIVDVAG